MIKYTKEYISEYLAEYGCTFLSEDFHGGLDCPFEYRCSCTNTEMKTFRAFRQSQHCCRKCSKKIEIEKRKTGVDEVRAYLAEFDYTLLGKFTGVLYPMEVCCPNGHVTNTLTFANFKHAGKRCSICAGNVAFTYEFVKTFINEAGYTLKSETYKNCSIPLSIECPNGHLFDMTFTKFKMGRRCQQCHIEHNRGPNHKQYNHQLSIEERRIMRKYPEYYAFIQTCMKRDNYTCQCCNQTGVYLNVHHILNYSSHKDLRTDINNGITLCRECHQEFHKTYSYYNNTLEQLNEFIAKHKYSKDRTA